MANPASASTSTRRHDTRPSKAARRKSFVIAAVTPDQVRQYLVDVNTYEQFIELIQDHLEEALPVLLLWACHDEWVETQNQQNDLKELEELRRDLATRTTERDTTLDENNLLKELLNTYRNTSPQRTIPSVVVMDNTSFHHTERIEQMCADAGAKLVYLPPHSPGPNPIEEPLSELKTFIKRNWHTYEDNPVQGFDMFPE
jgi:predicted MPP superfamily phosphohydrolase